MQKCQSVNGWTMQHRMGDNLRKRVLMESGRIGMIRRSLRAELVRLRGTGILGGSPELAVRCRYLLIDGIQ